MVLVGQDVYVLDEGSNQVLRLTPRPNSGYGLDTSFKCSGNERVGQVNVGTLLDIGLIPGPNVMGTDAVMALGTLGELLYCAPGAQPLASTLPSPDAGWIRPAAVEVYTNRLYVLDPGANQIWQFQDSGGAYTQSPIGYFSTSVYDLSNVVEFSIAGGDVFLLHKDGHLTNCTRANASQIATCIEPLPFVDQRPGLAGGERLADVIAPVVLAYDPPPEPSLYLLDASTSGVYQLSLKLALVRQFRPRTPFDAPAATVAIDPAKRIFVAAGDNVYVAARP
jgi:hypothetical protein